MSEKITIGIADMKMAKGEGMLVTYALGSCIGICLHDPAPVSYTHLRAHETSV